MNKKNASEGVSKGRCRIFTLFPRTIPAAVGAKIDFTVVVSQERQKAFVLALLHSEVFDELCVTPTTGGKSLCNDPADISPGEISIQKGISDQFPEVPRA